jgi:hypothetical protein
VVTAALEMSFRRPENLRRNGLQLVRYTVQAFRMAEEQVSIRRQIFSQTVDDFYLRFPLKIDQDVAAEN